MSMNKTKREIGDEGESVAERYLKSQGYRIIGKNMECRYGEIDIVARKENCLYFVEIKSRSGSTYGSALESISEEKMGRIRRTAEALLLKHKDWQDLIPFLSALAIDEDKNGDVKIEFLPDAFE